MKNSIISKSLILVAAMGIAAAAIAEDKSGYVLDTRGAVVKSGYGLCWRTGYWTPSMAIAECDPELLRGKPAAAQGVTEKMSLSADGLFDFGKSTLKPAGKKQLDDLAAKLKGMKVQSAVVTGHTDRFGTAKFNQALSTKRAETVKAYLVSKGVAKDVIKAEGKGSAMPKTTAGQCEGKKSKAVVECLAPNRRVDVEVTATK